MSKTHGTPPATHTTPSVPHTEPKHEAPHVEQPHVHVEPKHEEHIHTHEHEEHRHHEEHDHGHWHHEEEHEHHHEEHEHHPEYHHPEYRDEEIRHDIDVALEQEFQKGKEEEMVKAGGFIGDMVEGLSGEHEHEIFRRGFHHAKEKYHGAMRDALHALEEGEEHRAKHILHEALED
jgi:hypothetical protein